ncbi:EamA family transporter RarD [Alkalihalobacillus oceani]|uniref:EamA family transporter RarD n=1 Tax=Halalkalibacter oceani TaxID=1653776 RepID=UPI00203CCE74|nr:EamA family transporter RarD [Halalkalibacter oceani]MCM3759985.1 EamA family transporter RarD [Halalkalibacter oceani]
MQDTTYRNGVIATVTAYLLWGILPLYWKLLEHVPAMEVLAHRIIWSLVLMFLLLLARKQLPAFWKECKIIFSNKKSAFGITFAAFFISINWFLFIWAVANERVVEASLGYYINPLISVLLGILFLKERFTRWQAVSFVLAFIGVMILTLFYGVVPWVSLILACSFGIYGLLKKTVQIGALFGLTIETLITAPFALGFLYFYHQQLAESRSFFVDSTTAWLLIIAGAATAIPLLLFATGARRIPLSLMGFLQYIAPTLMLILGVFLYKEPFHLSQLIAFLFIWTGLFIFTSSRLGFLQKLGRHLPFRQRHRKSESLEKGKQAL